MVDFNLSNLAKKNIELHEKPTDDIANDRHASMLAAIAPYARKVEQKNVTPVYIDYKKRKTKLVLALCPQWAAQFPPFNLARLSGVAKSAGYETHILDINVRTNSLKNRPELLKNLNFDFLDPSSFWRWVGDNYLTDVHPVIEPILQESIDEIVELNPDIIGFSMYYGSEEATKWCCQELKRRLPKIKIAIGGSNVHKSGFITQPYYDYVVSGEGENILLQILNEIEQGIEHDKTQFISQPEQIRVNLNGLPMPDYESIDFSLYGVPNGINTEISRGCTAKCTFCEETHFWKYRQRQAVDLITEIEWLYYNKGTDVIWFIDSLVNGNLNELRAFCKAVVAKGLDIRWTGYARCDGRMTLDYFKDLKDGGCIMLNYGCESGSQHVLDDMDKKVTVAEMEQNFKDCKEVGIFNATNWIVGFPTETLKDFCDTMTFIWRMRNMNINNIGAGTGFGLSSDSVIGQNLERFNLADHKYQGHWITRDFSKGGTHVMSRVKCFHIFLDFLKGCTETEISYPPRYSLARDHYKIILDNPSTINEIDYEDFDYNIIKIDINPYANSLVNEMWPLFRILWKCRGGFEAEVKFDPSIDLQEFGTAYGPEMFYALIKFKITKDGEWEADFKFKFDQIPNPYDSRPEEDRGPFFAQEFSRLMNNPAIRARRLAKPSFNIETGRTDKEFSDLISEEKLLNSTINFSFEYHYFEKGNWNLFDK